MTLQDFDANKPPALPDDERAFRAGGQTFTLRKRVRPEALSAMLSLGDGEIAQRVSAIDSVMRLVIRRDDIARWDALRADDNDDTLIDFGQLSEILTWAIGVVMNRPLENASSSSTMPQTIVDPSPGNSSSPVASPSTG